MSQLFIACKKCGQPVAVDEQLIKNALALGDDLTAQHDVCPGEERPEPEQTPARKFRAQIVIAELPEDTPLDTEVFVPAPVMNGEPLELVCGAGYTVEARNAAEAVNGPLTTWLSQTWPKLQDNAAYADPPKPA